MGRRISRRTFSILTMVGVGLFAITVIMMMTSSSLNTSKTGFIKNSEIFIEFKGKKELEAKLTKNQGEQQAMLDSLALDIATIKNELTSNPNNQELKRKKGEKEKLYIELNRDFTQQKNTKGQEYTEVIWKQINQYIQDYGKVKGYDYIYGASGNGSLMYAKEAKDITDDVINYINNKYEGLE